MARATRLLSGWSHWVCYPIDGLLIVAVVLYGFWLFFREEILCLLVLMAPVGVIAWVV